MLLIKELGSEKSIGNVKTEDEEKDRALTKLEGKTWELKVGSREKILN